MDRRPKCRLAVLGSGKGATLVALAEACRDPSSTLEIAIVVSDVAQAGILARAAEFGLPAKFLDPGPFKTKFDEPAEKRYLAALAEFKVDLVVLAGFMRVLKSDFIRAFPNRVVNIHPSLLPSFPGLEAWRQALDHGVKVTGCTVHFVDQGVDTGPIIAQRAVPVLADDTSETLHQRIQAAEQSLYPATLALVAGGKVQVEGRTARIPPH